MSSRTTSTCVRHNVGFIRQRALPCHARPDTVLASPEADYSRQFKAALAISASIGPALLLDVGPASAHGLHSNRQWVPRRHYRGLKEERRPPKFKVRCRARSTPCLPVKGTSTRFSEDLVAVANLLRTAEA